ncbi:MAG TPA: S8 family serine peptidase [Chitinophaga sp.]|uniref:S8 family peptidase n=1 Tax=Chitinophaga sp. TaxID=1869181 RepID=UPI002CA4F919|nr:S8 family serine peptidase [Chitinophaga sp.]HVI45711.1 S8 family serine peptidase [Chitinophaga sp.]
MKKVYTLALGTVLCWASSCNKSDRQAISVVNNDTTISSIADINRFIKNELQTKGKFEWSAASINMVQGALLHSDSILSVGYQPAGFSGLNEKIHTIDIHSSEWQAAREEVLRIIRENEKGAATIVFNQDILPVIDVKVSRQATLKALRSSSLVRYAEPTGYGDLTNTTSAPQTESSSSSGSGSGCGGNTGDNSLVAGAHYFNMQPGTKKSWNYTYSKIDEAWTNATGKGIKVMIIDTGVSPDQENLGDDFNQGASSGRTIQKKVTRPGGTTADGCGHGTKMASVCAAPRGNDNSMTGVAYNANLVTVRAADDVLISGSDEVQGVTDAFTLAGNSADVKIVSMSMGTIIKESKIADAIRYAKGKGKLIFCAAGTSTSFTASFVGVIFPAYMDEVVAVTGVKDNQTERCADCHVGKEVDFTVVMERVQDGKHPLSLAMAGDVPSTVGGSSVATATCAGIAALVWSKFPSYTSSDVLNKMAESASLYTNKSSKFGWGVINAKSATE